MYVYIYILHYHSMSKPITTLLFSIGQITHLVPYPLQVYHLQFHCLAETHLATYKSPWLCCKKNRNCLTFIFKH